MGSGDQTQACMSERKALSRLSHLPRPWPLFLNMYLQHKYTYSKYQVTWSNLKCTKAQEWNSWLSTKKEIQKDKRRPKPVWSKQWESSLMSPVKDRAQESTHLCPIRLIQINHMSQIALQSRAARTGWALRVFLQFGYPKRTWIKTLFNWELLVSLSSTRQIIFHLLFRSSQAKQKIKIELQGSAGSVRIHVWILLDKTCFEDCLFFYFLWIILLKCLQWA